MAFDWIYFAHIIGTGCSGYLETDEGSADERLHDVFIVPLPNDIAALSIDCIRSNITRHTEFW